MSTEAKIKTLSKSRYVLGTRCKKALWFSTHTPEKADTPDPSALRRMQSGTAIGKLAQKLFPQGIEVTENHFKIKESAESTQRLISEGALVLYEATALNEFTLARADILVRESITSAWDLYEVKSTNKPKPEHTEDLAFQTWCFRKNGFKINKSFLVTLNSGYVRQGDVNINKLFSFYSLDLEKPIKDMGDTVEHFLGVINSKECPNVSVGSHCNRSYSCPFHSLCNAFPAYGVHEIPFIRDKAEKLRSQGVNLIEDIPSSFDLTDRQWMYVNAVTLGPQIDYKQIKGFLQTLREPISFLDFEGHDPAIPSFDGMRPYVQSPFQFSLRFGQEGSAEYSFIPEHNKDPRKDLLLYLLDSLPDTGSIVVWSASYEIGILQGLARLFPEYEERIIRVIHRIWDLMIPFGGKKDVYPSPLYVDKDFHGSHSLKKVLPVLVPSCSYSELDIQSGDKAAMLYEQWLNGEFTQEQWLKIRNDLILYCGMDTKAMQEILKVLQGVAL